MAENKKQLTPEELWEQAGFSNNYLFWKILTTYPDVCKRLIEILLHIEIDHIEQPEGEETFDIDLESKGVRFDVFIKSENKIFDLEMIW